MKIISLKDRTKKITGVAVEICLDGTLKFTRYGVNENGIYVSDVVKEGIEFNDPADDFENITKSPFQLSLLKRRAIKEVAEKHFPGLKTLYIEA